MALRGPARAASPGPSGVVRRDRRPRPPAPTPARDAVLEALGDEAMTGADLARAAGVSAGVVKGLMDEGVLAVDRDRGRGRLRRRPTRTMPPRDPERRARRPRPRR